MKNLSAQSKWPKKLPELTEEQVRIKDEWMKYWHELLPSKFGIIEEFNHGFPVKQMSKRERLYTLEIGAGLGGHIAYENLDNQNYSVLELRENMAEVLKERFPKVNVHVGDIQKKTNFSDAQFDRVVAVHVLEHLPDLPSALDEVSRILKDDGQFTIVIPCEGGMAYGFARYISSNRIFRKKFNMEYGWLMKSEHVNKAYEIIDELKKKFTVTKRKFFPILMPFIFCNLCIGLNLVKKGYTKYE